MSDHPLLSEGLKNLLGNMDDLDLIGPRAIASFTLADLHDTAPDVVLFAAQETDDPATSVVLLRILQHAIDLPVIQVGLSGHTIVRVYTSHTLPARSTDLIATIRRFPFHSPPDARADATATPADDAADPTSPGKD